MADIYRPKVTRYVLRGSHVRKGTPGAVRVVKISKKWYGRVKDRSGKNRKVPLCEDRSDALQMLGRVLAADRGEIAIADFRPQLTIDENLSDYERYLRNKDNGSNHVRRQLNRIRRVLVGCRFLRLQDLNPTRVDDFLADLRYGGMAPRTSNHHLTAIKGFTKWLCDGPARRLSSNPLRGLSAVNARVGRKLERRALTGEEFSRLVATTRLAGERCGISGPDRVALYSLAVHAGLRRKDCWALTPIAFDLKAVRPTVTIQAGESKNKRTAVQPLRADLAKMLPPVLESREPRQRIWGDDWFEESAAMLRSDLEAAGIPFADDHGHIVDFHALRHTFITWLVRGGVHPKVCQQLARHASINTTMDYYAHVQGDDLMTALATLPEMP